MKRAYANWFDASVEAWKLGMDASAVIGLRAVRLAQGGPGADAELGRMMAEKMQAAFELQAAMLGGRLGTSPVAGTRKVIRHLSRKVKANRKRLE